MKAFLSKIAKIVCLLAPWAACAQSATLLTTFTNPVPSNVISFGRSVAALGSDRVIVGATTVWAGDEHDVGVAYLFNTNGALLTTFTNPAPQAYDEFGGSIAVLGSDRVFIGARGYAVDAGGFYISDTGIVYLFNTNGTLLNTITNPTPRSDEEFGGYIAAVGSDCLLVGGPYEYDPSIGWYTGVAYLFSTNGALLTTFTNLAPVTSDTYFGWAVAALGSNRLIIAAPGTVYVFSTNGTLLNTVFTPDTSWISLAVMGNDRILVGAPDHSTPASYSGQAYLFDTNGTLLTTFINPAPARFAEFGMSVAALGSGRVLISAVGKTHLFDTNGTLLWTFVNPTTTNDMYFGDSVAAVGSDHTIIGGTGATNIGAAYLFSFDALTSGLSVTRSDANLFVSWPKAATSFVLDEALALGTPPTSPAWTQVSTAAYQTNAKSIFISVPSSSGNRFYRLRKP